MSSVGYDLDTSGGLMPLIRALIKPPDEDASAQKGKPKPQHPYYKRPGKGHNHDSCDACGEGGDLICCDRCPASFHLGCYDPPLDENDIPTGLWLCKECRASDAEKPASSKSSRAQSPADDSSRSLRNKKIKSKDSKEEEKDREELEKEIKKEEKELTPMEILVKAAKVMNPRQFELPREMKVPCPFPGTEKEGSKNGNASVVTVDKDGCVPYPCKLCFVCQGTCKAAPLLQCDYCPLLFHQDCLDPPLTALPTGRWMCPNHVEQYIDWKLVNSISATERVALWDQFAGPVDQHAIKVDFIRRARNYAPRFRIKVPGRARGRVLVPAMVREHYARPPPLLPSRREHVRCARVLRNLAASAEPDPSETDDSLPKAQICLNLECPQYAGAGPCPHAASATAGGLGAVAEDTKATVGGATGAAGAAGAGHSTDSDSLSDSDFEYLTSAVKRRKMSVDSQPPAVRPRGRGPAPAAAGAPAPSPAGARYPRVELRADAEAEALLAAVDRQLHKLDERLVKLLAWQRLQQVLVGSVSMGAWRVPLSAAAERAVRRSIDRGRLARYGFRHVALPSELLSRPERDRISRAVWGAVGAASPPPPPSPAQAYGDCALRAAVCAVLRPARNGLGDGLGRAVPMRLSRLTVGADSGCDVVLDPARCRRVARRHATIFYDEVSRHFELINYSEWGSRVNGVLYACDAARAAPAAPEPPPPAAASDAAAPAPAAASAPALRLPHRPSRANGVLSITSPLPLCACADPPPGAGGAGGADGTRGAWEGSALVPHGALLQFGCQMFVFSIVDAPVFPYEEKIAEPAV